MSLQQILMQRAAIHFQNKLGNFEQGGAPSQIGDIVANKIEQDRMIKQDMLAKQENNKKAIEAFEKFNSKSDKLGRVIENDIALEPKLKITKDGNFEFTAETESSSTRIRRQKDEAELNLMERQNSIINEFNKPDSKLTVTDLINQGIKPSDAEKMEELRVPVMQSRQYLQQAYDNFSQEGFDLTFNDEPQIIQRDNVRTVSRNIVAPELTPSGRPIKRIDIDATTDIDKAKAEVQIGKEVDTEAGKVASEIERDFNRASATADTAFDLALSFAEKQYQLMGVRPGQLWGAIDKFTPSELNEFKDAFKGAGVEAAALIARLTIPGVRGANITEIFKGSTATIGKTMEANAVNISASMGNALGATISMNSKVSDVNGRKVSIQDLIIDDESGLPISSLGVIEKTRAINKVKREFISNLNDEFIARVYKRNPALLQPETVSIIEEKLKIPQSKEEIMKRIEELRGKNAK
jgi:hypothetical protein